MAGAPLAGVAGVAGAPLAGVAGDGLPLGFVVGALVVAVPPQPTTAVKATRAAKLMIFFIAKNSLGTLRFQTKQPRGFCQPTWLELIAQSISNLTSVDPYVPKLFPHFSKKPPQFQGELAMDRNPAVDR